MAAGTHSRANGTSRKYLDEILKDIPVGSMVNSQTLAIQLRKIDGRIQVTTREAGTMLKERDDVKCMGHRVWMKVSV